MTLQGKVLSVETRNLSEPAVAAAAISDTTLYVADASTFEENGGLVTVGGLVLAYSATDVDLNTLTLTVPLIAAVADQDLVEVYPPTPVKTALVDLGEDGGDAIPATVPHTLLDKFVDGTRDDSTAESVTLEQRGTFEIVVSDAVAEPLQQTSLDYVEGEIGVGIAENVTQVADLQALGQVGAGSISADAFTLNGVDLASQLDESSIGKMISARLAQQGTAIGLSTTNTKILELNCGTLPGGRTYRVSTSMLLDSTGTLALTDRIIFEYHYTSDGTTPTTASAEMDGGFDDNSYQSGRFTAVRPEAEIDVVTAAPLRIALCARVFAGAGAYTIYTGVSARSRPVMSLYDDGPLGARNDAAITLTGGGLARFTKTFNAIWVFSVNDAVNYITVGDGEYGIGGQYGLVGFDSAAIVAGLAGSLTAVSCTLKWRVRTRKAAGGLDTRIVSHNYSSKAAAVSQIQFPEGGWSDYPLTAVVNVNNAAPNVPMSTSLGTGVFAQFKAATRKGVGFVTQIVDTYGQTANGSGTVYGDGTNECQIVFTYDGTS